MQKHFYKKLLQQQFDFCINHLTRYCKTKDHEALHQFRVDVKKIRSLMSLAKYCNVDFRNKDLLHKLTLVYRKTSFIRNNHILIHELTNIKSEKLKSVLEAVKLKTQLLEQSFIENAHSVISSANKACTESLNAFPKASIKDGMKFISKRKRKIKTLLINKPPQRALHGIRKKLKQLLYIMRYSENQFTVSENEIEIIIELQDKIGIWHDLQILKQFLKRKQMISEISKATILKIDLQRQQLLIEIYALLNKFKTIA